VREKEEEKEEAKKAEEVEREAWTSQVYSFDF